VLRRRPHTCLERALVLQRWEATQGRAVEVIIGVRGSSAEFAAHAWLEGESDNDDGSFRELMRLPAA
jgi:Transglutaminase-like superfamily